MNLLTSIILVPAIGGLSFVIAGIFLGKFPPKKINSLYGYRTKSSMKNIERWDFAQKHSAKEMTVIGVILMIISTFGLWWEHEPMVQIIAGLVILVVGTIAMIYRTERALKNKFREE